MSRPVTLFTGQWADLPLEVICEKASKWGYEGIELPCWGDHFNVQKALSDEHYCKGRHDLLEQVRAEGLGDLQSPGRPGGLRPDRRAAQADPARARLGRRQARRRPPAGRQGDDGHGPRCAQAGRQGRQRLHRLVDLAPALLVPARLRRHDRGRVQGPGRPLEPDPRRLQASAASSSAWRSIPPRSPSTSTRPRWRSRP